MSNEKDEKKKGFSGLDSLVSDVDDVPRAKPQSEKKEQGSQTAQSSSTHTSSSPQRKSSPKPAGPRPAAPTPPGSGNNTAVAWFFAIGFVIFIIVVANLDDSSSPSYSSPNTTTQQPRSAPSPASTALPTMTKPPVGTNHVHSVKEIRWCLAEDIRIETIRNTINSDAAVARFNVRVEDYNRRCGSYQYYENTLSRAKREINAVRSIIAQGALGTSQAKPRSAPNPTVKAVQEGLTALGYSPGPIDGYFGAKTKQAIQAFQRDYGLAVDGYVGDGLLQQIQRARQRATQPRASSTPTSPVRQAPVSSSSPSTKPTPSQRPYFTRGSHQDEVLRAQGTPSDMDIYSAYEIWHFGYSTVKISKSSRRVLSWDNNGNLRVSLKPGAKATGARYFTRGSHEDDVLAIQGTPSDIDLYSAYEIWHFGYSTVKISKSNRTVLSWDNNGNLKAKITPGGQTTTASYITRGSHEDDVVRIQGTPSDIDLYSAYEIWHYGYSTLKISKSGRRVMSWDNNGNLKVRLKPGQRTTGASVFTRGSHEDDVLAIQGTPSDIDLYSAYEIWHYGYSTVKISKSNRTVLSWDNNGNLKVRL